MFFNNSFFVEFPISKTLPQQILSLAAIIFEKISICFQATSTESSAKVWGIPLIPLKYRSVEAGTLALRQLRVNPGLAHRLSDTQDSMCRILIVCYSITNGTYARGNFTFCAKN